MKEALVTATVLGRKTIIYTPAGADGSKILIYFHGHGDNIGIRGPKLIEALRLAHRKPILMIPQLQGRSEPGDLATKFNAWLTESRKHLEVNSDAEIAIISHSGGYKVTANAVNQVNYVSSVALLDSLYGNVEDFYRYTLRSGTKHFIDIYGPSTAILSKQLLSQVKGRSNVFFEETKIAHDAIPQMMFAKIVDRIFN